MLHLNPLQKNILTIQRTCSIVHFVADNTKLIVDASAVLAVILEEPEKADLVSATAGSILIAPSCLQWEIGNAFSAMIKRKRLTLELALKGLAIFETIPIQEMKVAISDTLRLCDRYDIYAYDAYYLQLAKKVSIPLLTLDQKMIIVAEQEKIKVQNI